MPLCLLLGTDFTALLLVDAVVVDLMLLCVHILGSVIDDITCVIEQVAYTNDDLCVEIIIDRHDRFLRRLISLFGCFVDILLAGIVVRFGSHLRYAYSGRSEHRQRRILFYITSRVYPQGSYRLRYT